MWCSTDPDPAPVLVAGAWSRPIAQAIITNPVERDTMTTTIRADNPLAHLAPAVLTRCRERVTAGEALTVDLLGECLRDVVKHEAELILNLMGESTSLLYSDEREEVLEALAVSIYHKCRAQADHAPPRENPRWVALRRELGREPTVVEFLTWHGGAS